MTEPGDHDGLGRAPGTAWVSVDGEVVALDLGGRAHVLTSTGALLWPLLDGRTTSVELAADVADVFGVEPAVADDDVRRFVEEMTGRGLIRRSGTAETERIVDVDGAGRTSRQPSGQRNSWSSPPPMAPPDPDWIGAVAVEVGDQRIGLRADASDVMDQLVQIFRPWIVEGDVPADGFGISIDRRGGAGPRLTPQLLFGRSNVLRSRSRGRLLRCLDVALGSLAHEGDGLRIDDMAALVQRDAAALVPATVVERSTAVERAVAEAGASIAEQPALRLDLERMEVVVIPGLVDPATAPELMDDLATPPGRYALRSISWSDTQVAANERRATAVARLAELVDLAGLDDRQVGLDRLVDVSERCLDSPISRWDTDVSAVLDGLR